MIIEIKPKNVYANVTFNRFLYAALQLEAEDRGTKMGHVINEELTKLLKDKISLLKIQEASKYNC